MSIKLLLADDSITIQKVIGIIFGSEEYSLTVVDNGKAAVEKARELCPDVLLIDALMPGMNGYEVCEAIRATPELAAKPILILTGSFEPFDEAKAKKCGADDFLAKPFESQQIVKKVNELAEMGASRAAGVAITQPSALSENVAAFSAPEETFVIPEPQPEFVTTSESSDIWGAFTPAAEPPTAAVASPEPDETIQPFDMAPDVFAIVNEETDSQIVPSAFAPSTASTQQTGSQWIPVEEHTFDPDVVAVIPEAVISESAHSQEAVFGEISFEDGDPAPPKVTVSKPVIIDKPVDSEPKAPEPVIPAFEEPVPPVAAVVDAPETPVETIETPVETIETPVAEPAIETVKIPDAAPASTATAVTGTLTEEQLKAEIAAASKEVIERIVWEVVPDLAEVLIREAIRKIKEGV